MNFLSKLIAGRGVRNGLTILIYHRVLPEVDPLFPGELTQAQFEWQLDLLARDYKVLPLSEAVECLKRGRLPTGAAAITFDDGYADNYTHALPLLQKYRLPATVFVASGYLDGGMMWNERVIHAIRTYAGEEIDLRALNLDVSVVNTAASRTALIRQILGKFKYLEHKERETAVDALVTLLQTKLPDDQMMSSAQLRALADSGVEIGAHTRLHPILATLPSKQAYSEMADGCDELEAIIGYRPRLFAYPNGKPGQDYTAEHVEFAKKLGFVAAVSTAWGCARPDSDFFQLPRFTPWDQTPLRFNLRLARNYRQFSYEKA